MERLDTLDQSEILELRRKILVTATLKKEGHIPSALSVLDLLYAIYVQIPRISKNNVLTQDSFILSKGHASLALYAILEHAGVIDNSWTKDFSDFSSDFGGHPDMRKIEGVEASTGSLGHGLPIAIGKVLANRVKKKDRNVTCLVGDGEMNEGTNWESFLLASHHSMSELTLIIDHNNSNDRALSLGNLEAKLNAFGFYVICIDGHSQEEILGALMKKTDGLPKAIIAKTIKGYGISQMQNNPAWHHAFPTSEQLDLMLQELK